MEGENNRVNLFATFSCKCLALDRIFKVHNFSEFLATGEGKPREVWPELE